MAVKEKEEAVVAEKPTTAPKTADLLNGLKKARASVAADQQKAADLRAAFAKEQAELKALVTRASEVPSLETIAKNILASGVLDTQSPETFQAVSEQFVRELAVLGHI